MDAWIIIIAIAVVIWWINNNKTSSTSKTKVREISEYKTQTGKIFVERTVEYDDREMSINDRPKYTPRPPKNYTPLQQPITIDHQEESPSDVRSAYIEKTRNETRRLRERISNIIPDKSGQPQLNPDPDSAPSNKQCPNCRRNLPISAFRASSKNQDGHTKWCAECLNHSSRSEIPSHLKLCPKCNQRRMKSNFAKNSNTSDGLAKWCKFCMAGIKR